MENTLAIREKDWLINALWAASGPDKTSRCLVNLPLIITFRNGKPLKAIKTNENGFISRVSLSLDENSNDTLGDIRACIKLLLDFSKDNGYDKMQPRLDDVLVISALYLDGERENLDMSKFEVLIRNDMWTRQIMMLQGYVPIKSSQPGLFSVKPRPRNHTTSQLATAADHFVKQMAKHAEFAYAQSSSALEPLPDDASVESATRSVASASSSVAAAAAPVLLKVLEMQLVFVVDPHNKMVFHQSEFVSIDVLSSSKHHREIENVMLQEKLSRELTATEEVNSNVLKLLKHALHRGMSLRSVFTHFDARKNGFVDVDALINGLSRLGMGITFPVGERLMQTIGGVGCLFLSIQSFATYLNVSVIEEDTPAVAGGLSLSKAVALKLGATGGNFETVDVPEVRNVFTAQRPEGTGTVRGTTGRSTATASGGIRARMGSKKHATSTVRSRNASRARKAAGIPDAAVLGSAPAQAPGSPTRTGHAYGSKKVVPPLNLMCIAEEINIFENVKYLDEPLHLENGLMMTYRLIHGSQSQPLAEDSIDGVPISPKKVKEERVKSVVFDDAPGDEPDVCSAEVRDDESPDTSTPSLSFTLFVVPDLFMTLETLQQQLTPLLTKFPYSRIILVGLPGLPRTSWPASYALNNELHAKAISKVFKFLHGKEKLVRKIGDPIFLMGIGTGGYSLTRFVTLLMSDTSLLQQSVRGIVYINSFLKMNGGLQRIFQDLRDSLAGSSTSEVNDLVSSLHLWDQYISSQGRDEVLKSFWKSRRGMCNAKSIVDGKMLGEGFLGVLEQLNGFLLDCVPPPTPSLSKYAKAKENAVPMSAIERKKALMQSKRKAPPPFSHCYDGTKGLLEKSNIPIIAVQSSEDVFVDPRNGELFTNNLPSNRFVTKKVCADALLRGSVCFSWLKSGHEVLQERPNFVLGLLTKLATYCGVEPVPEPPAPTGPSEAELEIIRLLELAEERRREEREKREAALLLEEQEKVAAAEAKRAQKQALKEKILQQSQCDTFERTLSLEEAEKELAAMIACGSEDSEGDLEKENLILMMEEMKAARHRHEQEERELVAMRTEDYMSLAAAEYRIEEERKFANTLAAKEAAARKIDEALIKKKTERRLTRQAKASHALHHIEQNEKVMSGGVLSYDSKKSVAMNENFLSEEGLDTNSLICSTQRLFHQLICARQKTVEGMLRHQHILEKTESFRARCFQMDMDVLRLRRAVRLVEMNPSLIGGSSAEVIDTQMADLKHSLAGKKTEFDVLCEMKRNREQQLLWAAEAADILIASQSDIEKTMNEHIKKLMEMSANLRNKMRSLKMAKDKLVNERNEFHFDAIKIQARIDLLMKEFNRIKDHKGQLVDTDVWMEGTLQRAATKELKRHLTREVETGNAKLISTQKSLKSHKIKIHEITDSIALTKRDCDKSSLALTTFNKAYRKILANKVSDLMHELKDHHQESHTVEDNRQRDLNINKKALLVGAVTAADKTRIKENVLRTREDRKFVALEMVLSPERYLHLTDVDVAEMQFDEDYQCDISKVDLERILKLPPQINLALPFLHTAKEVDAHRLFNSYLKGMDAEYFHVKDFLSAGGEMPPEATSVVVRESGLSKGLVGAKGMEDVEAIHDILVKEAMRARVHSLGDGDEITVEELDWLVLDKILCPYVFAAAEWQGDSIHGATAEVGHDEEDTFDEDLVISAVLSPTAGSVHASRHRPWRLNSHGDRLPSHLPHYSVCPYDRAHLLRIRTRPVESIKHADEKYVRSLLDMYFVDDDESIMGGARLKSLCDVSLSIRHIISHADHAYQHHQDLHNDAHERNLRNDARNAKKLANLSKVTALRKEEKTQSTVVTNLETDTNKSTKLSAKFASTKLKSTKSRDVAKSTKGAPVDISSFSQKGSKLGEIGPESDVNLLDMALGSGKGSGKGLSEKKSSKGSVKAKDIVDGEGDGDYIDDDEENDLMDLSDDEGNKTLGENTAMEDLDDISEVDSESEEDEDKKDEQSLLSQDTIETTLTPTSMEELALNRVWGSWEVVHPAASGQFSQGHVFMVSTFNAERDNAASYAITPDNYFEHDDEDDNDEEDAGEGTISNAQLKLKSVDTLTSMPKEVAKHKKSTVGRWLIVDTIAELAVQTIKHTKHKIVLIANKEPFPLMHERDQTLDARQSRTHRFAIDDTEHARMIDVTVSIVFQGLFGPKGYKVGRLAAALFRLPDDHDQDHSTKKGGPKMPTPIGYSPYEMQAPNLPESLGRVCILHRPKERPILPGKFQVVVGCASTTKYSIEITCRYSQQALPVVDKLVQEAKSLQVRLPKCLIEIDMLDESLRLAESKLVQCEKMIVEAEVESKRAQQALFDISTTLEKDNEDMSMLESERREMQHEYNMLEIDFTNYSMLFVSRSREVIDINDGLVEMRKLKKDRLAEKKKIKDELEVSRRDLPSCIVLLRNSYEATNIAASLNTHVVVAGEAGDGKGNEHKAVKTLTPAGILRAHHRRDGWDSLSLEEMQWVMLDQALNPTKYEWLREQEESEAQLLHDVGKEYVKAKNLAAVDMYRLSKNEIEHIMKTPFSMLTRREITVRKLLSKYHDQSKTDTGKLAGSLGFDSFLAERTRAKNSKAFTKEETEWSYIDRILHPEIWAFYVRSDDSLDFMDRSSESCNVQQKLKKRKGIAPVAAVTTEDTAKSAQILGRILQVENTEEHQKMYSNNGQIDLMTMAAAQQKKLVVAGDTTIPWECPYDKDQIFRIWRTPRHVLADAHHLKVYDLLHKFNGTYSSYQTSIMEAKHRQGGGKKDGHHIQWDLTGKVIATDIDLRARMLLRELDRVALCQSDYVDSEVLHAKVQRFPREVLTTQLTDELDIVLQEQIKERERGVAHKVDSDSEVEDVIHDVADDESSDDGGMDGVDADDAEAVAAIAEKVKRRAKRRQRKMAQEKAAEDEVRGIKSDKKVALKGKSGDVLRTAILQNTIGVGGCLACRTNPCSWMSCIDEDVCTNRKEALDRELERVRLDKDTPVFTSDVCLSAQLGGNRKFKRLELLEELTSEASELDRRIQLNNVDKELHDAYATRSEYIEITHLHGYPILLWTNHARKALSKRHSHLVAMSVAREMVDGILDWMLEGWMFGERQSSFNMLGYVPTVKKDGMIRAGQDQIQALGISVAKLKERADNKKKGIVTAESARGLNKEKCVGIEEDSRVEVEKAKVLKLNKDYHHTLDETETTLRFGLFMLSLMYFRAMVFLRREKKSWSGEDDELAIGKGGVQITDERMRMNEEEKNAAARKKKIDAINEKYKIGARKRREREAAERKAVILAQQVIVRRAKQEARAILTLQRLYRGHLGRKATAKWALKRAELGALHYVLDSTAIFIQRVYRGYRGRCLRIDKRREMAYFIATLRAQEAAGDEAQYWATHPWQRFKKNHREWKARTFRKAHQNHTMGGSRLSAEEEARLAEIMEAEEDSDEIHDDDLDEPESSEDEEEDVEEECSIKTSSRKSKSGEGSNRKSKSRESSQGSNGGRSKSRENLSSTGREPFKPDLTATKEGVLAEEGSELEAGQEVQDGMVVESKSQEGGASSGLSFRVKHQAPVFIRRDAAEIEGVVAV